MKKQATRFKLSGLCLLLLILTEPALAKRQFVDETKKAGSDGYIEVNIVRGNLVLEGWDRNEIQVEGDLDEQTREFVFDATDDSAVIAVRLPNNMKDWGRSDTTDVTIKVPRNSHVNISTVSTDIRVSDIKGGLDAGGVSGEMILRNVHNRVNATTVSGQVNLRNASGKLRLKSVSGDVEAENAEGEGSFKSVSGEVIVRHFKGELELESVSGDVVVTDASYTELRGSTVSGDFEVDGQLQADGVLEFDSVSGSVRVRFEHEPNARFDLQTRSGSIRNRLSEHTAVKSKYVRDETLRMTLGDGRAEVILESRSGDITLTQ